MGRPKKSAPAPIEPEEESQEIPEEEPEVEEEESEPIAARPSMSKADACRAALAAGIETTEEAMEFTKKEFGVEIKATDFTLYKSKAKGAAATVPARRGRKPKAAEPAVRKPMVEGYVAPPEKPTTTEEPDLLLALEGVKELMATYGPDKVRRIVDLLS